MNISSVVYSRNESEGNRVSSGVTTCANNSRRAGDRAWDRGRWSRRPTFRTDQVRSPPSTGVCSLMPACAPPPHRSLIRVQVNAARLARLPFPDSWRGQGQNCAPRIRYLSLPCGTLYIFPRPSRPPASSSLVVCLPIHLLNTLNVTCVFASDANGVHSPSRLFLCTLNWISPHKKRDSSAGVTRQCSRHKILSVACSPIPLLPSRHTTGGTLGSE